MENHNKSAIKAGGVHETATSDLNHIFVYRAFGKHSSRPHMIHKLTDVEEVSKEISAASSSDCNIEKQDDKVEQDKIEPQQLLDLIKQLSDKMKQQDGRIEQQHLNDMQKQLHDKNRQLQKLLHDRQKQLLAEAAARGIHLRQMLEVQG